jgi:branched-subunit amino acid aminotransferase/4-amino-4-deoxychorismate lyase
VPAGEATVSALDRGLTYGLGLYETIKLADAVPVFFDEHCVRLEAGLAGLEIEAPWGREQLATRIAALTRATGARDGGLRLVASAGPPWGRPSILIHTLQRVYPREPLAVIAHRDLRASGEFKSVSFVASHRAQRAAVHAGADDALFVDTDGRIHEAATANVFVALHGVLSTSPLDGSILPGVVRRKVEELARADGIEVVERYTLVDDLTTDHTVILTSSVRGLAVVGSVDQRVVGCDTELVERLRRLVGEAEAASAAAFRMAYPSSS